VPSSTLTNPRHYKRAAKPAISPTIPDSGCEGATAAFGEVGADSPEFVGADGSLVVREVEVAVSLGVPLLSSVSVGVPIGATLGQNLPFVIL
jgi:hypothetical protein